MAVDSVDKYFREFSITSGLIRPLAGFTRIIHLMGEKTSETQKNIYRG